MSDKPITNLTDTVPKAMDEQGSVGKQFTGTTVASWSARSNLIFIPEKGAIGGTAQKIGGPFDKEGVIGKQFTTEGSIGGTVQNNMGGEKKAWIADEC